MTDIPVWTKYEDEKREGNEPTPDHSSLIKMIPPEMDGREHKTYEEVDPELVALVGQRLSIIKSIMINRIHTKNAEISLDHITPESINYLELDGTRIAEAGLGTNIYIDPKKIEQLPVEERFKDIDAIIGHEIVHSAGLDRYERNILPVQPLLGSLWHNYSYHHKMDMNQIKKRLNIREIIARLTVLKTYMIQNPHIGKINAEEIKNIHQNLIVNSTAPINQRIFKPGALTAQIETVYMLFINMNYDDHSEAYKTLAGILNIIV